MWHYNNITVFPHNQISKYERFQIWKMLVLFCRLSSPFWILLFPKIHPSSFSNTSHSLCVMIQGTKVEDFKCLMASHEWLATLPTCDLTREKHYQTVCVFFLISLPTLYKLTLPTKL